MFHGPFSRRGTAIAVFGSAIAGFGAIFASAYYAQRLKGLW
jgi:hypothetical protein